MGASDDIVSIMNRETTAAFERGQATASGVVLTKRAAAAILRAQADAMTTLGKAFQSGAPEATAALSTAAAGLRTAATKLGG